MTQHLDYAGEPMEPGQFRDAPEDSDPPRILDYEPHLAGDGFGPERSLRWMLYHYYGQHLPSEKARAAADAYVAAITAWLHEETGLGR